jgi:hypothetical protein
MLFFNPVVLFFSKNMKMKFSDLSPYVFHVPCSHNCSKTEKLAKKYKQYMKVRYPSIAQLIEKTP